MGFQYVLFTLRTCRTNVSGLSNRLTCMPCIQRFVPVSKRYVLNNTDNPTFLNQMRWHSAKPQGQLYLLSSKQLRNVHSFTSTAVLNDVILFEHDRTRFFRFLALFCGGQFIFWTYLAYFAFTGLRNTQKNNNGSQKIKAELGLFSFDMNLGSKAWRFGFTLGCLVIGGIVGLGMLFTCRSVSRVVLHKGGRKVTVSTQSPLGVNKAWCLTVPLNQVACHAHRHESPSFIPLKVKDHKFYFLLDKEGTLNNHKLFDVTVGAYRPL